MSPSDFPASTVAIVGGGAVGCVTACELITCLTQRRPTGRRITIRVYEKRGVVGPGLAYDTSDATGLLNTSIETMSALSSDPLHFVRWLADRGDAAVASAQLNDDGRGVFVSRALVGEYLQDCFAAACRAAEAHGIRVEVIGEEVTRIIAAGACQLVETVPGQRRATDIVILALGNLPATNYEHLAGARGYFDSPYPLSTISSRVSRTASVVVLGARLSAVDAVLALAEQGHEGPMVLTSRHGFAPTVRVMPRARPLRFATAEALDALSGEGARKLELGEVVALVLQEIQDAGGGALSLGSAPAGLDVAAFADEVLRAKRRETIPSASRVVEGVLYALMREGVFELLGERLSERARGELLAMMAGPAIANRRIGIALPSAEKIAALLTTGRLEAAGRLVEARATESGFEVTCDGARRETRQFDVVINATGPSLDIARSSMPLVRALLADGMIRPDRQGGIEVDFRTSRVVAVDGSLSPDLFAVGVATSRVHFATNLLERNVPHVAALARTLAERLAADEVSSPRCADGRP
jgi:uncharacterized NAD(P)/FAD-binding protein YdhS